VFINGRNTRRKVETVAALEGLRHDGDYVLTDLTPNHHDPIT
jgi:hypothetical protein